ncbi:MAG: zinc ABC transporter substrate-binding protein [Phycisphaerae bacterium]|nr:zinc ABC transporter substrate-binding protein [Phycisphaerae bacterium]
MRNRAICILVITFLGLLLPGCENSSSRETADVAASNSFLECAAKDLLGVDTPVLRLTEPGMCPGHFDIRPSQVQKLRACRVLLRFDFQQSMDAKLAGATEAGLKIVPITIPGGLCEPDSYLAACRQTADALVETGLLQKKTAEKRLKQIGDRIRQLSDQCRQNVAPLKNTPVICSVHQEAFCRWLGLDVAATFRGADTESIQRLDKTLQAGKEKQVKLIVANRPEGHRCPKFLAERLGARVVVFENFPAAHKDQNTFDDMLRANVSMLLKVME